MSSPGSSAARNALTVAETSSALVLSEYNTLTLYFLLQQRFAGCRLIPLLAKSGKDDVTGEGGEKAWSKALEESVTQGM